MRDLVEVGWGAAIGVLLAQDLRLRLRHPNDAGHRMIAEAILAVVGE